jgi:hypothetical protein
LVPLVPLVESSQPAAGNTTPTRNAHRPAAIAIASRHHAALTRDVAGQAVRVTDPHPEVGLRCGRTGVREPGAGFPHGGGHAQADRGRPGRSKRGSPRADQPVACRLIIAVRGRRSPGVTRARTVPARTEVARGISRPAPEGRHRRGGTGRHRHRHLSRTPSLMLS